MLWRLKIFIFLWMKVLFFNFLLFFNYGHRHTTMIRSKTTKIHLFLNNLNLFVIVKLNIPKNVNPFSFWNFIFFVTFQKCNFLATASVFGAWGDKLSPRDHWVRHCKYSHARFSCSQVRLNHYISGFIVLKNLNV